MNIPALTAPPFPLFLSEVIIFKSHSDSNFLATSTVLSVEKSETTITSKLTSNFLN